MITGSVDTNILVRLVAQDDLTQAQAVDRLFARHARKFELLLVSVTVVLELEWVLRSRLQPKICRCEPRYSLRDVCRIN